MLDIHTDHLSKARFMRVMVSLGLCSSPEPDVYIANSKTSIMTEPTGKDGVRCMYVFRVVYFSTGCCTPYHFVFDGVTHMAKGYQSPAYANIYKL